jgi:hypothetical protein
MKMVGMGLGGEVRALAGTLTAFLAVACLLCSPLHAASNQKKTDPEPQPDLRIPVAPLGYMAPSSFYLVSRLSSISLDFVDNDHLLFTFRLPGLMKRLPDDPPNDEDQMIRADVLELPSGTVVSKAEWRMHDRMRYLWRLANGRFLVRQRSALFAMDQSLELKPFIDSDMPLESIQISPDRKVMAIEAHKKQENQQTLASISGDLGDAPPDAKTVQVFIMHTEDRSLIARAEVLNAVEIPMLGEGHLQSIPGKQNNWLIRYLPFKGEPRDLTQVESACHPSEEAVSGEVALIFACPRSGDDHLVSAVNLDGKILWQQRWESRYIWPTFQLTQDGSRFAYSSLQVSHAVGIMDPIDETTITHQMVGVFDTQTGQLRLARNATPILSAGQNYALSPDGLRFAILRDGAIEVYNLPPVATPAH